MTTNFENENGDNSENNNENEFSEIEEMGPGDESSSKSGAIGNIAEAWHTNPLFKFTALVVGVFAVGAAAIKFFGHNDTSKEVAHLARPPAIKEAPGGAASPYHRQQTELANNERIQRALDTNGSAIPTPIGQASEVSNNNSLGKEADPMKELRAETDQLRRQMQQQQQQAVQQRRGDGFDNSLAEAMQKQLTQLMSSWQATGMKAVTVSTKDDKGAAGRGGGGGDGIIGGGGDIPSGATGAGGSPVAEEQKPIVPAGTVSYAQLLSEANSDVPGPILAQIVSGPLTGARAIGAFQVADGYEKYLVMKFSLADRNGKDYPINAIALDPETTLGGMATEVDERYFSRVVLPAAASFIQGVGQAMGQGGTSITTNGSVTITTQAESGFKQGMYSGMGQAANTVGQFFQQQANLTKPLVRVAPGTPFGMFFLTAVRDPKSVAQSAADMSGQGYNVNYAPGEADYSGGASGGSYQNGPYTGMNNGYNSGRLTSGRTGNLPYVHQQNY